MDDLHMCGSHRKAWRRCDGALLVTLSDLFRIQGTQPAWLPQRYAIPSGLHLVGLSFVFQKDKYPTHLQAVE